MSLQLSAKCCVECTNPSGTWVLLYFLSRAHQQARSSCRRIAASILPSSSTKAAPAVSTVPKSYALPSVPSFLTYATLPNFSHFCGFLPPSASAAICACSSAHMSPPGPLSFWTPLQLVQLDRTHGRGAIGGRPPASPATRSTRAP